MRIKASGRRRGVRILLLATVALAVLAAGAAGASAASNPASSPVPSVHPAVVLPGPASGSAAVDALGSLLPDVAKAYGWTSGQLISRLTGDGSLNVDTKGYLFFKDPAPSASDLAAAKAAAAGAAPEPLAPLTDTFKLHSLPGAAHIIYLDFNGETMHANAWTTNYNGGSDIVAPPYDTDGNPATFSDTELTAIQTMWQRVSEDYAPFNVDVTTEYMGESYLTRSSASDNLYGMRVLISPISSYVGQYGGIAYVGVFTAVGDYNKPALVFPENLGSGNEKYVAEAASHENGHTLGLSHQGIAGGSAYYMGQGSGVTGWAPIMGAGYYRNVSQWAKGEYLNASLVEDEIAIMGTYGAPARTDDVGGTTATATDLTGPGTFNGSGIIGSSTDADVFRVSLGAGSLSVSAAPAALGPNLDILLDVLDPSGTVVATDNPPDLLTAGTSLSVGSGNYYIRVRGTGRGDPLVDGYTSYGSLGAYTITATNVTGPPAKPTGVSAVATSPTAVHITWTDNATSETGYYVNRWNSGTSSWDTIATLAANTTAYDDPGLTPSTPYDYFVGAYNGSGVTWADAYVSATTPAMPAAPTITALAPTSGPTTAGTSVVISGTDFVGVSGASAVTFGGSNATSYTVNSATQITAVAPVHAAGAVRVQVVAVGGITADTAADDYTYVAAPTISGIAPTSGPAAGGTSVIITGTNLTAATAVTFGGTAAATLSVNTSTRITATAPAHAAGIADVVVTTLGGTSATSSADRFTYVAVPTITALAPTSGATAGGTSVIITGTSFVGVTGAAAVTFGGTNATSYTVNSATQITAVAPAHAAGAVRVQVAATGGTTTDTAADDYTYVAPPTATRYDQTDPNIVKTGAWLDYANSSSYGLSYGRSSTVGASATVWFTGTQIAWIGMKGGTPGIVDVYIDGVKKTTMDLYSATALYQQTLWTSDTLTYGVHHMDLVRSNTSLSTEYIVLDAVDIWGTIQAAPPTIASLSPSTGSTLGGTSVTINGTSFAGLSGASAVTFGGVNAPSYTVNSSTKITAVAPAHAAGAVSVQVTTAAGSASSAFTYAVAPPTTRVDLATTTAAGLTVSGTWAPYTSASAYGGSYLRSRTAGAYVVIAFQGTQLDWITMKGTTGAIADIYVDGSATKAATVNLYASPAVYQQNVFSTGPLPGGYHTVKIVRAAANASGRYLTVDAVEVAGTLLAPVRVEENAVPSPFTWNPVFGSWTTGATASASGGTYKYINTAGAYTTFTFTGVGFKLIARTAPSYGNLTVTIDGVAQTVSLYSSASTYKKVVLTKFLAPGVHTVKIARAGTKSASSTGYTIDIDAIDLFGTAG